MDIKKDLNEDTPFWPVKAPLVQYQYCNNGGYTEQLIIKKSKG
ncbi:hypothetical protein GMES_4032 [Paraglaciecola mesophila KMM 241]|uniref:Uncharacterized protein n=1 Tax=Paraglaciecola mesophila KMM 241 TaxID=1128912 RepID=K6ZSM8_9ALTE|nr:hypothetical protein GMES_4032 [Paraglaciecola mesophila KMM 241]